MDNLAEPSKVTMNFAERRHVDIFLSDDGELFIANMVQDPELYGDDDWYVSKCDVVYTVDDDELELAIIHNKELAGLPERITTEKQLRAVIEAVANAR